MDEQENRPGAASNQTTNYKQPVDDEVLKAKDVQQPDRSAYDITLAGRWSVYGSINLIHNPDEQPAVDPLEDKTQSQQKYKSFIFQIFLF